MVRVIFVLIQKQYPTTEDHFLNLKTKTDINKRTKQKQQIYTYILGIPPFGATFVIPKMPLS